MLGNVRVLGDGENAAGGLDLLPYHDHGAIVQRTVLEENILNQPGGDIGIDDLTALLIQAELKIALNDDQCPDLGFRHVHAGQYDRGDVRDVFLLLVDRHKEFRDELPSLLRAERHQESPDLILKEDHQQYQSDIHKLIEDRAQKHHVEHLRYQYPDNHEDHNSDKERAHSRYLHHLEQVVQQCGYQQDVDKIFYSKVFEHMTLLLIFFAIFTHSTASFTS